MPHTGLSASAEFLVVWIYHESTTDLQVAYERIIMSRCHRMPQSWIWHQLVDRLVVINQVKSQRQYPAILVENHLIFPLPQYFPPPRRRGSPGIGYCCWRSKMWIMGLSVTTSWLAENAALVSGLSAVTYWLAVSEMYRLMVPNLPSQIAVMETWISAGLSTSSRVSISYTRTFFHDLHVRVTLWPWQRSVLHDLPC